MSEDETKTDQDGIPMGDDERKELADGFQKLVFAIRGNKIKSLICIAIEYDKSIHRLRCGSANSVYQLVGALEHAKLDLLALAPTGYDCEHHNDEET
jgi:hypothetical protein